ncbi:hypothetical protein [Photobacterium galatheae]|uniref:HEPN AbiU2-like domain-containing protein n=1 Tax=Photobacterium galatheae TaxID=1654360 RepID=A0A066RQ44_9GAMM|nr:hypothetical protein [Photobacterium galatheae]KDM91196.1 hypothetical protein EA58_13700 [Photobacterium galatheae]MCM0151739.1 hypothetical protein [Photobacterium galatheae]
MSQVNFLAYYKTFEDDIDKLSRYIEISEDNFKVYSIELTRLYLSICSEVDVVMKLLCGLLTDNKSKPKNMCSCLEIIVEHMPEFVDQQVSCAGLKRNFKPWAEVTEEKRPSWWVYHNKVKHDRSKNYAKANLNNVLLALAGLFTLIVHYEYRNKYPGIEMQRLDNIDDTIRSIHSVCKRFQLLDNPFAYICLD